MLHVLWQQDTLRTAADMALVTTIRCIAMYRDVLIRQYENVKLSRFLEVHTGINVFYWKRLTAKRIGRYVPNHNINN